MHIIFGYQNRHFKTTNLHLLHVKAVYKQHFNDIKIHSSIAIVLHNLNQPHILPLFFE